VSIQSVRAGPLPERKSVRLSARDLGTALPWTRQPPCSHCENSLSSEAFENARRQLARAAQYPLTASHRHPPPAAAYNAYNPRRARPSALARDSSSTQRWRESGMATLYFT
jgi:hypothetical protein